MPGSIEISSSQLVAVTPHAGDGSHVRIEFFIFRRDTIERYDFGNSHRIRVEQ
jgi:hypothetical protein